MQIEMENKESENKEMQNKETDKSQQLNEVIIENDKQIQIRRFESLEKEVKSLNEKMTQFENASDPVLKFIIFATISFILTFIGGFYWYNTYGVFLTAIGALSGGIAIMCLVYDVYMYV